MSESQQPTFLDIQSYRQKRWVDAARILPLVGALGVFLPLPFLFLPILEGAPALPLAIYFFLLWLGLILAAFVMSYRLPRDEKRADD